MGTIDDRLDANRTYVTRHGQRPLDTAPRLHLAVLTCMDSRLDLFGALGLDLGEVHLVRNAGGLATEDTIRSLMLSQRLLGTRSIMVIHHTRCGLEAFAEEELSAEIAADVGFAPPFRLGAYRDVEADVRATMTALEMSPFVDTTDLRGFVFDVDSGALHEVTPATS